LFLLGSKTEVKLDELREGIKDTGTGVGGSEGVPEGKVKKFTFQKRGPLFCFEAVVRTAGHCAVWLGEEIKKLRAEEEKRREGRSGRTKKNDLMIGERFRKIVKPPSMPGRKPETDTSKVRFYGYVSKIRGRMSYK
jgi:hypothetical protein